MAARGGFIDVRWTKGHPSQAQCQNLGKASAAVVMPEERVRIRVLTHETLLALSQLLSVQREWLFQPQRDRPEKVSKQRSRTISALQYRCNTLSAQGHV
eukprot:4727272-Pyramimonas_sp.AAC.1